MHCTSIPQAFSMELLHAFSLFRLFHGYNTGALSKLLAGGGGADDMFAPPPNMFRGCDCPPAPPPPPQDRCLCYNMMFAPRVLYLQLAFFIACRTLGMIFLGQYSYEKFRAVSVYKLLLFS